ncbi:MAG: S1 RNA-binding domain-containing protein [Clostridia bacterium]|nr:S1 RNA-binding domain-containing protein [Clostridia bacterium]
MGNMNENITFEELLNQTLKEIRVGQTVTGTVIEITPQNEVFIDIGYKADGIIPADEYVLNAGETVKSKFKLGDRITAVVLRLNDGLGNVLLSYNKARKEIDVKEFESKVNNDTIFKSVVTDVNDKGLIVSFNTIKIFIPLSLSGIPRSEDPHTYKGKEVKFKIVEYNPETNRIIGSIKVLLDEEKQAKSDEFWNNIEVGKVYTGTVTSLSEYGAFVDLEGIVQGLLHISEMTWERDKKPKDILKVGQEIKVKIKELDKENKRIKLIYDKKGPDPWSKVEEKYKVADVVTVKISNLAPFGAFAKIEKGIEGLIHISQICEKRITKPDEVLTIGQKVNAKIISIDAENKKIELSIRELEGTSDELDAEESKETAVVSAEEKALETKGETGVVETPTETAVVATDVAEKVDTEVAEEPAVEEVKEEVVEQNNEETATEE